jgi:heterodisulfide reductase subunit B
MPPTPLKLMRHSVMAKAMGFDSFRSWETFTILVTKMVTTRWMMATTVMRSCGSCYKRSFDAEETAASENELRIYHQRSLKAE